MPKPVLIIAGPTASGKSRLAATLAGICGGTIINADSMQVYGTYPILTAQPNETEQKQFSHRLYSFLVPPALGSAATWRTEAVRAIEEAHAKNQLPILVGGTGLYFEALMHGLSAIPDVPEPVFQQSVHNYETMGGEAFRTMLRQHDPVLAERLHAGDKQRLIRAYAVFLATGTPLSQWQATPLQPPSVDWQFKSILISPSRENLYANINKRAEMMLKQGALEEVRAARDFTIRDSHPVQKAIGVRELTAVLQQKMQLPDALAAMQQATRNYAKRQQTWFQNRFLSKEKATGRPVLVLEQQNKPLALIYDWIYNAALSWLFN